MKKLENFSEAMVMTTIFCFAFIPFVCLFAPALGVVLFSIAAVCMWVSIFVNDVISQKRMEQHEKEVHERMKKRWELAK